jgi:hypothetical protein
MANLRSDRADVKAFSERHYPQTMAGVNEHRREEKIPVHAFSSVL